MAETVKRIQLIGADELYADNRNPVFPIKKGTMQLVHRYVVDTDFPSGDNLRIDVDGAQKILYAMAKDPSNTFLTIAETDLATETGDTTRQGISLTTGVSAADVQIDVIFTV